MTIHRDLVAANVRLMLQADGPSGALVDHSRNQYAITANDFATDTTDTLFGINSFTGRPSIAAGSSLLAYPYTIEGWVKFIGGAGAHQVLMSAYTTQAAPSSTSNMWVLFIPQGQTRQLQTNFRRVGYGDSGAYAYMNTNQAAFAGLSGGWKHFFICVNGPTQWMGYDGIYTSAGSGTNYIDDHVGNALFGLTLNDHPIDWRTGNPPSYPNTGKLHSLCLTSGVARYPYWTSAGGGTLSYRVPDAPFTDWYRDTGVSFDIPDQGKLPIGMPRIVLNAGATYRNNPFGKKIAGHVTYTGVASARRVGLFTRGGILLDAVTSRAGDGYFEFSGLSTSIQYMVAGFDDAPGAINAEIADHLVPA